MCLLSVVSHREPSRTGTALLNNHCKFKFSKRKKKQANSRPRTFPGFDLKKKVEAVDKREELVFYISEMIFKKVYNIFFYGLLIKLETELISFFEFSLDVIVYFKKDIFSQKFFF